MGYDVHLVRTEQWFDAESDPVTREHVDKVLAADPTLSWSESDYVEMTEDDGSIKRYYMINWNGGTILLVVQVQSSVQESERTTAAQAHRDGQCTRSASRGRGMSVARPFSASPSSSFIGRPNSRFEFARVARPTRKGDAPLLVAQAGR
jgi:hypothetical protein